MMRPSRPLCRNWPAPIAPAVLIAWVLQAGCSPSINTLQVTVDAYISAVSLNDVARIMDLSAPCQRALQSASGPEAAAEVAREYRGKIEEGYMTWQASKRSGDLELDALGVALIRGIGLGEKGAAAIPLDTRFDQDNMRGVVTTRALTNYESTRWQRLPPSVRLYLLGMPFGKVVNFAPSVDDPSDYRLLSTVDLEWTLIRIPGVSTPGAPADWFVESVRPLPDTAMGWTPPKEAAP